MYAFKSHLVAASREVGLELRTAKGWLPAIWLVALVLSFGGLITYFIGRIVPFRPNDFSPFVPGNYFREVAVWFLGGALLMVPFSIAVEISWRALRTAVQDRSPG
jgi:hypothetical protein